MNENNNANSAVITWNGQTYMFSLDVTVLQVAKNNSGISQVSLEPLGKNDVFQNFLLRLRMNNGGTTTNE